MIIPPANVEQSGPGIDLSNQPEGVSVQMSDAVRDLEYARNAVTLTLDLSGFEHVRLSFKALEYGDEPHARKSEEGIEKGENDGVFVPVADFDFDGVAVSADGIHSEIPGQTTN